MEKNNSFATFLIIGPTCFFLGILFSFFPYDYHVLWSTPPDRAPYFDLLENHLRFLYASPPIISRILHITIGTGLIGFVSKLYKPSEANMLFDGASLALYISAIIVYIINIVKGLRVVAVSGYGDVDSPTGGNLSREDTLSVLATRNIILALVLIGILVLQAGKWYAQSTEDAEIAEMDRAEAVERKNWGRKKQ